MSFKNLCFVDLRQPGFEALTRNGIGACMKVNSNKLICSRNSQLSLTHNQILTHGTIPGSCTWLGIDFTCDPYLLDS